MNEDMEEITGAIRSVADAIRPSDAAAGPGANGGTIDSLTEAVMDMSHSLNNIAEAIGDLASAVRERNDAFPTQ